MAIIKRPKKKVEAKAVVCPVCHRVHTGSLEFGPFCCASCLQTVIRPLILSDPRKPR